MGWLIKLLELFVIGNVYADWDFTATKIIEPASIQSKYFAQSSAMHKGKLFISDPGKYTSHIYTYDLSEGEKTLFADSPILKSYLGWYMKGNDEESYLLIYTYHQTDGKYGMIGKDDHSIKLLNLDITRKNDKWLNFNGAMDSEHNYYSSIYMIKQGSIYSNRGIALVDLSTGKSVEIDLTKDLPGTNISDNICVGHFLSTRYKQYIVGNSAGTNNHAKMMIINVTDVYAVLRIVRDDFPLCGASRFVSAEYGYYKVDGLTTDAIFCQISTGLKDDGNGIVGFRYIYEKSGIRKEHLITHFGMPKSKMGEFLYSAFDLDNNKRQDIVAFCPSHSEQFMVVFFQKAVGFHQSGIRAYAQSVFGHQSYMAYINGKTFQSGHRHGHTKRVIMIGGDHYIAVSNDTATKNYYEVYSLPYARTYRYPQDARCVNGKFPAVCMNITFCGFFSSESIKTQDVDLKITNVEVGDYPTGNMVYNKLAATFLYNKDTSFNKRLSLNNEGSTCFTTEVMTTTIGANHTVITTATGKFNPHKEPTDISTNSASSTLSILPDVSELEHLSSIKSSMKVSSIIYKGADATVDIIISFKSTWDIATQNSVVFEHDKQFTIVKSSLQHNVLSTGSAKLVLPILAPTVAGVTYDVKLTLKAAKVIKFETKITLRWRTEMYLSNVPKSFETNAYIKIQKIPETTKTTTTTTTTPTTTTESTTYSKILKYFVTGAMVNPEDITQVQHELVVIRGEKHEQLLGVSLEIANVEDIDTRKLLISLRSPVYLEGAGEMQYSFLNESSYTMDTSCDVVFDEAPHGEAYTNETIQCSIGECLDTRCNIEGIAKGEMYSIHFNTTIILDGTMLEKTDELEIRFILTVEDFHGDVIVTNTPFWLRQSFVLVKRDPDTGGLKNKALIIGLVVGIILLILLIIGIILLIRWKKEKFAFNVKE